MKIANGMEFVDDERAIGKWEYVDIVENEEMFNPKSIKNPMNDGGFDEIYFMPNGKGYWMFEGWTKGFLLDQKKSVASRYTFKVVNNVEYLFLEWKMGNYIYGGRPATYYVLEKEN